MINGQGDIAMIVRVNSYFMRLDRIRRPQKLAVTCRDRERAQNGKSTSELHGENGEIKNVRSSQI